MFARACGGDRDVGMHEIRRGNDDRVDVIARDDFLPVRGRNRSAGLLSRGFERRRICVAQGLHADIGAKREAREMILQRDAAGSNDGEVQCLAHSQVLQRFSMAFSSFTSSGRRSLSGGRTRPPAWPVWSIIVFMTETS